MTNKQITDLVNAKLITGGIVILNEYSKEKLTCTLNFKNINIFNDNICFSINDDADSINYMIKLSDIIEIQSVETYENDSSYYTDMLLITITNKDGTEEDIILAFNMSAGNALLVDKMDIKEFGFAHKALINDLKHFKNKPVIITTNIQGEMFDYYDYENCSHYSDNNISIYIQELDYEIFVSRNVPCVRFIDKKVPQTVINTMGIMSFLECNTYLKQDNLKVYHIGADGGSYSIRDAEYVYSEVI